MNQLVDVANQLPLYRQNIAKIEAFHISATGQLGHAAESVKDVVRELTAPGAAPSALPPQGRNQKRTNAPAARITPMPVQMVEAPTNGWTELRDLGTPVLAPLERVGIVLIFTIFMLLKREDLRKPRSTSGYSRWTNWKHMPLLASF